MSTEHLSLDVSSDGAPDLPRLDKDEFKEAFDVFSKDSSAISKEDLPLFLRSIGLSGLKIEDAIKKQGLNELDRTHLKSIIDDALSNQYEKVPGLTYDDLREWPSHSDVQRAFAVFDQEGHGYIPVQQLKRFLLQAQMGFQEEELEKLIRETCKIDNDNQIDYVEFVRKVESKLQEFR